MEIIECKGQVNDALVETVERLLEEAKEGKVQALVAAGVNAKGDILQVVSGEVYVYSMAGALFSLATQIMLRYCESVRDDVHQISLDGP